MGTVFVSSNDLRVEFAIGMCHQNLYLARSGGLPMMTVAQTGVNTVR